MPRATLCEARLRARSGRLVRVLEPLASPFRAARRLIG
jgi:hypothetical protein